MVAQENISVGDSVRFTFGTTPVEGVVVEDRGPIGAGRVRILTVRVPDDPYDDTVIEMPQDELVLAPEGVEPIPKEDIIDYLKRGGLIQILRSNMSGGRNQPCVWLRRDNLGNVVHTFAPERGVVGGARVPFYAIHHNRIFEPKLEEVLTFLSTFGLSRSDGEEIVRAVGTAP